ncbi:MAG: hypothetical protein UX12_C0034G0003 [Candidatus Collierbacteria bacterium GW2011_GWC1_45_47]|uniref:Uncharacterized protein n=3 Tax=Candidatus Collieribacteriota TaxID=1752725 RepID=A0A0G1KDM1_9BACT|nr:MAG: hypothetical protein UW23_C0004G0017 [Candidatus Collierbacteria bacterium GW2011_GWA1_44_12]KKT39188.1 MAG: hypothetical protein UW26_C0007G0005 [Candidatus Collierbacteria bacterium GW2011_GWF1_44_12]KKT45934.1 MAG: hypothetical protein UW35_C0027G0013 [Candidatus Collierbacteria bacterium GW2011_GWF2_44_15]KKU08656.1 MAG: hypothetical protein UX12_C0034G0003 [Candidatus Collierbacteria bacterium GW2011_GWC1_45_47]
MKRILVILVALIVLTGLLMSNIPAKADGSGCEAPTVDGWIWTQDTGNPEDLGYWFYDSENALSFTVPEHISSVDYFVWETGETFHAETGEEVINANTASAFCTPQVEPTPEPENSFIYLPLVVQPLPELPAGVSCDRPSQDGRWTWETYRDGSQGWHIGPLATAITMTVPDHIQAVYSSLDGAGQPPAYPGDVISFHEATAFCAAFIL